MSAARISGRTGEGRTPARLLASLLATCLLVAAMASPGVAWNSILSPSEHAQFANAAINRVTEWLSVNGTEADRALANEIATYRDDIIRGAENENTHLDPISVLKSCLLPDVGIRNILKQAKIKSEFDLTKQVNWGTNWGSDSPGAYLNGYVYWRMAYTTSKNTQDLKNAYYCLGSLLHLIQDQAVPTHACDIVHGTPETIARYGIWDEFEKYTHCYYGNPLSVSDPNDFKRQLNPAQYYYETRLIMRKVIIGGFKFPPENDVAYYQYDTQNPEEIADPNGYIRNYQIDAWNRYDYCIWNCYWVQPTRARSDLDGVYGGGYICKQYSSMQPKGVDDVFAMTEQERYETTKTVATPEEEAAFALKCEETAIWASTQALFDAVSQKSYKNIDVSSYTGSIANLYPHIYEAPPPSPQGF